MLPTSVGIADVIVFAYSSIWPSAASDIMPISVGRVPVIELLYNRNAPLMSERRPNCDGIVEDNTFE